MSERPALEVRALLKRLKEVLPTAVDLRHEVHRHPRVSGDEHDTLLAIADALRPAETIWTAHGAGLVRVGSAKGPAIGLRAELDALPIVEQTDVEWRSTNGAMHACGHDVHIAAAFAVARVLDLEGAPVPLLAVFQPREEALPSGAKQLIDDPALLGHDIAAFIGAHLQPRLVGGTFAATPGPVNAAADEFYITIVGSPGHAAYPHVTADPIVTAADLVGTLQHLVSRQADPMRPTVLTVGSVHGGASPNVVPQEVRLSGTLRTFNESDRQRLGQAIIDVAASVAKNHGCTATTELALGEPVLLNDPELTRSTTEWLHAMDLQPGDDLRSCGADDFSYYCSRYPSLMIFVGTGTGDSSEPGLHHPSFLPPDLAVGHVAQAMLAGYLAAAERLLKNSHPQQEDSR